MGAGASLEGRASLRKGVPVRIDLIAARSSQAPQTHEGRTAPVRPSMIPRRTADR